MEAPDTPGAREPFAPFVTQRLTIRPLTTADAAAVAAYRNDPEVARYQDWPFPYPPGRAEERIAETAGWTDPVRGEWWNMAIEHDGDVAGDLALGLDGAGAVASIGYTLAGAFQHRGIAGEAVGALVDRVFARVPVHRIEATVDPENLPSIRLLEGLGFRSEGVARQSVEIRGAWLDDARYGLLRDDHARWAARPTTPPAGVRLVEITPDNAGAVLALRTFEWQQRLVSPNAVSFADALVPELDNGAPVVPWLRAIEADGELVGFVMLAEPTATQHHPYLWRLMVDRHHQHRRIGSSGLQLVIEQARAWGGQALEVSWMPGFGTPQPFYLGHGFVPTGDHDGDGDGDEIVAELSLVPPVPAPRRGAPSASAG